MEKTHKGAFKSFEDERRSMDEERERRQKENDKKVQALWPEFEKLMKSKEMFKKIFSSSGSPERSLELV